MSDSESRTEEIGRAIGEVLRNGDALLLHGEMGAGKTCMARGIALGAECEVSARSPTFIILAEYPAACASSIAICIASKVPLRCTNSHSTKHSIGVRWSLSGQRTETVSYQKMLCESRSNQTKRPMEE